MLIQNAVVHTMHGPVIPRGWALTQGGRIIGAGPMSELPRGADTGPVVDAEWGHLLPGLIDAHCHVGLYGAGGGAANDDLNEGAEPCTPQIRGLDGVNPLDEYFAAARQAGVTCLVTGPGSANPIGGQSLALKTAGTVADRMAVLSPAAMKFALGENPKGGHGRGRTVSPQTRMATAALIREQLRRAVEYRHKLARAEAEGTEPPSFDARLDALIPVVEGTLPAHFHAHRADDVATAVRIAGEFGLDAVIVHGTEAHLVAGLLAGAGVPVITGPTLMDKSKPELKSLAFENVAALSRAGVRVAICTDHPETPIQYLPLCAALAARAGLDEEDALAAVTINAARILHLEDRLGSIAPGRDADMVLFDGPPLDLRSRVRSVWIDGQEVTG